MFYIVDLLSKVDLDAVRDASEQLSFSGGSDTAGDAAKTVKNNLQASDFDKSDAAKLIKQRLSKNEKFKMGTIPLRLSALLLSKYDEDMEYGSHVDNSLMQSGQIRTDIAFTIFVSDPATSEGGELRISQGEAERSFKLPAGAMLLYPASHLHRVMPTTSGSRIAVVGWVQSMIADPAKRSIIYDLSVAQAMLYAGEGKSEAYDKISLSLSNLLRLWANN